MELPNGMFIEVLFYSGCKGQETPRAIVVSGQEFPIDEILWRKRGQDKETRETFDLVRCRAAGQELTLRISPGGECRLLGRLHFLIPS